MNVFLSARYSRIKELNHHKETLEALGEHVTSRWLLGEHQIHGREAYQVARSDKGINELEAFPEQAALFAQDDYDDLRNADYVICFSEEPRNGDSGRGGRHVELGLALAWGKAVFIVGPRENVFHCLPGIQVYTTFQDFLETALLVRA